MALFIYKYVYGLSAILFTSSMISGQMWNHIKKPVSMFRNHEGIISYIYPDSSYQSIYESYYMVMLYTMLVFGVLLLNKSCTMKSNSKIMALGSIALVMCLFTIILSTFNSKTYGYPYSVLDTVMTFYKRMYNIQA